MQKNEGIMITAQEQLQNYFGTSAAVFQKQQRECVESILSGHDTVGIMPTGSGKSVCYQIPSLIFSGLTVVISPLYALIQDQLKELKKRGIPACGLCGISFDDKERDLLLENDEEGDLLLGNDEEGDLLLGNNKQIIELLNQEYDQAQKKTEEDNREKIKLVYTTPEFFCSHERDFLRWEISLLAIDEAHCISAWGRDFRTSYYNLGWVADKLREKNPGMIVAAFTATADKKVREDIVRFLHMEKEQLIIRRNAEKRKNLHMKIQWVTETESARKLKQRLKLLGEYVKEREGKKGIIFCSSKRQIRMVKEYLDRMHLHIKYETFYAYDQEDSPKGKKQNVLERQEKLVRFKNGEIDLMIATNAFGMGINIEDIRYVVHFMPPLTKEAYLQQCGRAGRDKKDADCLMFIGEADYDTLRTLLRAKYLMMFPVKYSAAIRKKDREELCAFLNGCKDVLLKEQNNEDAEKLKALIQRLKGAISREEYWRDQKQEQWIINCSQDLSIRLRDPEDRAEKITYFESVVADGVYSLWYNDVTSFSVRSLACWISGNPKLIMDRERKKSLEGTLQRLAEKKMLPIRKECSGKTEKYFFRQEADVYASLQKNKGKYDPFAFKMHAIAVRDRGLRYLPANDILNKISRLPVSVQRELQISGKTQIPVRKLANVIFENMTQSKDWEKRSIGKALKERLDQTYLELTEQEIQDGMERKKEKIPEETKDFICVKFFLLRELERIFQYSSYHGKTTENKIFQKDGKSYAVPIYQRRYYIYDSQDDEEEDDRARKEKRKVKKYSLSNRVIYSRCAHENKEKNRYTGMFYDIDCFSEACRNNVTNREIRKIYIHNLVCCILMNLKEWHYIEDFDICDGSDLKRKNDKRDEPDFRIGTDLIRGVIIH